MFRLSASLLVLVAITGYQCGYIVSNELGYGEEEISYEGHDEHQDYHEPAKYSFNYAVHDPHTGDEKQHYEERNGDEVKGTYSLKEADGTTRIVEYKADKHNGFQAVVHKVGEPKQEEHISYGEHEY
ncbi:cuticle protein 19-like [Aethina tumida]|uniref:cuticle protein 19-like n=1 Tax=Aethina tumida TaxID=116153 RepID=UPI00096B0307|nr:cuticle protein 19-like [Aethina tumida]